MADSKVSVPTATIASHSSLHAVLPMTTQLWNLAISSLCQEPQTFWVPKFHSSFKGPYFSCVQREQVMDLGVEAREVGLGGRPGSCAESHPTLTRHLPFVLPLSGMLISSLSKSSSSFKALLTVPLFVFPRFPH